MLTKNFLKLLAVLYIISIPVLIIFTSWTELFSYLSATTPSLTLLFALYRWQMGQAETRQQKITEYKQKQKEQEERWENEKKRARPVFYYAEGRIFMTTLAQTPVINTVLKWKTPKSNEISIQELGGISSGESFFVQDQFAWILISTVTAEFETVYAVINSKKETYHMIESNDGSVNKMLDYQLNDVRDKDATLTEINEIEAFNIVESHKQSFENTTMSDLTEYTALIRAYFEKERYTDAVGDLIQLSQSQELETEDALNILDSVGSIINDFDLKRISNDKRENEIKYLSKKVKESYIIESQKSTDYKDFVKKWSSEISQGYITPYDMYQFLNDIKSLIALEGTCNTKVFLDVLYYYVVNCVEIDANLNVKTKIRDSLQLLSTIKK
ncbi:hypothetical protein WOSG25_110710 [Weissella oryzae SG25]|uniref:Uncharacterized protein n=1 Tax=Weissella oryzae (strain DSM 25784 / JCM 18191 / LMG 30913 / SG25) TaxID=1329250 RepID=A0A069CWI5_WEIOS|nr:hypothetical protein [Weissella oryzae]GAK31593.1 hypothetical protein WOSG25_110710 [Weissella oryzae SG25]